MKLKKLKLWWNSKTEIVTKFKNLKCDETKKTQIVTKLKLKQNSKIKLWQNLKKAAIFAPKRATMYLDGMKIKLYPILTF